MQDLERREGTPSVACKRVYEKGRHELQAKKKRIRSGGQGGVPVCVPPSRLKRGSQKKNKGVPALGHERGSEDCRSP